MTQVGISSRDRAESGVRLGAAAADPARVWHPYLNPLVAAVLSTPAHRLFGRSIALLTVRGVRTGRRYRFPVRFAEDDGVVYVIPGGHEHKTWWRNLVRPQQVGLRLRGRDHTGIGQAFSGRHDPQVVETGLRVYLATHPKSAWMRGMALAGGLPPGDLQLHRLLRHEVIVRIVVADRDPARPVTAGSAAGTGTMGHQAE
jgi:hypothetical protein